MISHIPDISGFLQARVALRGWVRTELSILLSTAQEYIGTSSKVYVLTFTETQSWLTRNIKQVNPTYCIYHDDGF